MNARRLYDCAGRRLGLLLIAALLILMPLRAGEVIITVTGTLSTGFSGRGGCTDMRRGMLKCLPGGDVRSVVGGRKWLCCARVQVEVILQPEDRQA